MTENSHSQIPHPREQHPDDASGHQGDDDGDSQAEGSHQETSNSEDPAHIDVAAKEANGIRTIEEKEDGERQQRDAGLRQEIYKCQDQIHVLNANQDILLVENDRLRNERNECRDKLDRIQSKLLQDFCFKKYPEEEQRMGPRPRGKYVAMDRIIDEILQDLADRDRRNLELVTETSRLEHNLETLQKSLLSNVERFRPTQDDELISNFESLASVIKVITRDVPSSVDCNKLAVEFANYTLIDGVSVSYWKDRLHRKCLLEAAIWSILMDTIFSTPFYVFGEYADLFTTEWKKLFMRAGLMQSKDYVEPSWPSPSPLCEKWRYVTIEQLQSKVVGEQPTSHEWEESDNQEIDVVVDSSHQNAKIHIEQALIDALIPVAPGIKPAKIQKIVRKACELAVQLGLQRCRLQIIAPKLDQEYIARKTTDMMGISGCENIKTGRVAFIVNPGLRKWGDGHGGHLDQSLNLVPALVFIEGE